MKRNDNLYSKYQKQIKDKDSSVHSFILNTLAKTQSMFIYEGLPETIPQKELETILQRNGTAFITKVNDELYAFSGSFGGEPDVYGRPMDYIVTNIALNLNKTYNWQKDGVLIENDSNGESLLPLIGKYAVLYTDGLISLNTASILTRITMLISASDDKTKESADEFMKKILDGDFSIIAENAFFKGISMQTATATNATYITQLIELIQYYKASMLNEIGLNANYNMKRERLNLGEVSMNVDVLLPYVDNMLKQRTESVEKINEMYGTDITVKLYSSWAIEKDNADDLVNINEISETVETEETTETEETAETDETEEISETAETEETEDDDEKEEDEKEEDDDEKEDEKEEEDESKKK